MYCYYYWLPIAVMCEVIKHAIVLAHGTFHVHEKILGPCISDRALLETKIFVIFTKMMHMQPIIRPKLAVLNVANGL